MSVIEGTEVSKFFPVETGLAALFKRQSFVKAVNDIDLEIEEGEIVGLIGESGCGKTTLAKLLTKLYEPTEGEILLHDKPYADYGRKEFSRNVQMIFQDPFKSLNPRMTINRQLKEPLNIHGIQNKDTRIRESLEFADLTPPEQYLDRYPHELSGGEKQRASIARALLVDPSIIIADEPISMLDVSIRAGILDLFEDLAKERGISILYVSHDIATVRYICDRIAVMYLGKIVERSSTQELIANPKHPYTERLISATPRPDPTVTRQKILPKGDIPDPINLPTGCFFKDRCKFAVDACDKEDMSLRKPPNAAEGHEVACHRAVKDKIDWDELDVQNLPDGSS